MWVIEYNGTPACWITDRMGMGAAFDVTFQRKLAQEFTCSEDAKHEILRLGLSGDWIPATYEKSNRKEEI